VIQVLSKSVADLFKTFREIGTPQTCTSTCNFKDTEETERFCRKFNRLFDIFNIRHLYKAERKRNDDLLPYTNKDDVRLQVYHNKTFNFVHYMYIVAE
jgi:hypothetical protein